MSGTPRIQVLLSTVAHALLLRAQPFSRLSLTTLISARDRKPMRFSFSDFPQLPSTLADFPVASFGLLTASPDLGYYLTPAIFFGQ